MFVDKVVVDQGTPDAEDEQLSWENENLVSNVTHTIWQVKHVNLEYAFIRLMGICFHEYAFIWLGLLMNLC